jgi:hypothetical protein
MPSISFSSRCSESTYKLWVRSLTDDQLIDEASLCMREIRNVNLANAGTVITAFFGAPLTGGLSLLAAGGGVAAANAKGVVYRRCYNIVREDARRRDKT